MHSDTPMFNFFEKSLRMKSNKEEICEKSNRIQIAVGEKYAKTIRKMWVKKHENVIRNVLGKKSLSGNAAVTHIDKENLTDTWNQFNFPRYHKLTYRTTKKIKVDLNDRVQNKNKSSFQSSSKYTESPQARISLPIQTEEIRENS